MVVLSQPLKICSFAPSTPLRQASLALARKERKRGKNEVSRYTINTACLTPPLDDPFLGQNRDSVFNVGFIDLLQYEQHEALYRDRVYIVALGKTTTYVAFPNQIDHTCSA